MEQSYFAGIEVGSTLYKLLRSARRRYMSFEFSASRNGDSEFLPKDDWGCAHMPSMAVNWVVSKQTHQVISTALTELYEVKFSNTDILEREHIHLSIDANNVRDGLRKYLSTCLTWILLRDEEVNLTAHERFDMINAGSLDNYGCRGKKIRRIQKMHIKRVEGEGECYAGRGLSSRSHPCDRITSYKIIVNSRKNVYTCDLCFRWFFSDSDTMNPLGLW